MNSKTLPDWPNQNPFKLFGQWFEEAKKSEPNDPNAMALAVIDEAGRPSVRIVLLKAHDERGFVFYTNYESRKGKGLLAHPDAEICFHWKSLRKQIRILGKVEQVPPEEADEYYNSRPRNSRLGAWASKQTQAMDSADALEQRMAEYDEKYKGQEIIPRPPHWGGFRIIPDRMEFWYEKEFRLHDRGVFTRASQENDWNFEWLYP